MKNIFNFIAKLSEFYTKYLAIPAIFISGLALSMYVEPRPEMDAILKDEVAVLAFVCAAALWAGGIATIVNLLRKIFR